MQKYIIEIISPTPPQVHIGDKIVGGEIIAIKSNEPEFVSAKWLNEKTGLSKTTIVNKLRNIAQGSNGKFIYPRIQALALLQNDKVKRGRPRLN